PAAAVLVRKSRRDSMFSSLRLGRFASLGLAFILRRIRPPPQPVLRRHGSKSPGHYVHASCDHSALMLAARTTLPHFSVSSAINLAKSAAEPARMVPPRSRSWPLMRGSANAVLISLLILSTLTCGVLAGMATPYQALAS